MDLASVTPNDANRERDLGRRALADLCHEPPLSLRKSPGAAEIRNAPNYELRLSAQIKAQSANARSARQFRDSCLEIQQIVA